MSRQAYPTQLRDDRGNEVRLPPKPFAVGGEGAVFDVLGKPDLVAKLYSKPQSKERCDKLRAMAKLCSPDLLKIAAWPTATLNAGNPAGVDGILMPKVMGYLEIHHLYSVAQRKKDFPEADWGFLLHTARNCAIAFEAVHGHGHVVGDVNQKNVMVSKKGIVAFVDCDSFQVAEGSRIFRCAVGVPEYTPPELHGKNFASLDRVANHDLFGLAVLVFHLLMMGRHPFSGVPLVKADIPIEKAIQEGHYAYTRNTASARLKPPPHVPPVTMLDPAVLDLFERAFGSTRRPTATEWRTSLDAAMKQLARCKNDPKHSYLAAAGKCPWCQLIAVAKLMFFLPGQGAAATPFRPEDIQQLIHKLDGMQMALPAYVRPKPSLPIQAALPAELRSVKKPSLLPRPALPAPVQKPSLAPLPSPPSLVPTPPLKPLPARPPIPIRPVLRPHPLAPVEPPRPKLNPLPLPPVYPPPPIPGPSDPFLPRVCVAGMIGGFCVVFVALPVGVIMIAAFAIWWVLMFATENQRREISRKPLKAAHQVDCDRMDEEYAELCRPIEEANQRLLDAWQAANAAKAAEHSRRCMAVDQENRRILAPWEATKAAIEAENERARSEIDQANRRVLAACEAENASRQAAYYRARAEIESANQRLIEAWEVVKAARQAEHDRACREVDATNRRLIADWEAANAPWIAEEKRWRDRLAEAEAKIRSLEAEFNALRPATAARFRQRKDEASGIVASHDRVMQDYEKELKQAEVDSKKIQLEEHLDKSLIRQAKLKGITNDRILSLESFGIETAKDVSMLSNQKVPGIGPVLSGRLFAWRDSLASSFVPKQALPESEKNRIASRYAPVLRPLGQSIQEAIQDLEAIVRSHRAREGDLLKAIGAAVQDAAIAEAHVSAMKYL
jgi:DNA-binding helix-hairpin-helix protein with protein kinase domain